MATEIEGLAKTGLTALRRLEPWRAYSALVIAAGVVGFVLSVIGTASSWLRQPAWDTGLAVFGFAAGFVPLAAARYGDHEFALDATDIVFVAAILSVGPKAALAPVLLGNIVSCLAIRTSLRRRLFSAAIVTLSMLAVASLATAWGVSRGVDPRSVIQTATAILVVYLPLRGLAMIAVVALLEHIPSRRTMVLAFSPRDLALSLGVVAIGACGGALLTGSATVRALTMTGAALLGVFVRYLYNAGQLAGRTKALLDIASALDEVREEDLGEFVAVSARRFVRRPVTFGTAPPSAEQFGAAVRSGGWIVTAARPPLHSGDRHAMELLAVLTATAVERKRLVADLDHRSRTDALTGLANRRAVDEALESALARANRSGSSAGVVLLDLDGFKQVNDAYGHAAGDQVLVAVATVLAEEVRAGDAVGRLGGDEFVVVVSNASSAGLSDLAARAGDRIAATTRPLEHRTAASIGIALSPQDGVTATELLAAADRAMYETKRRRKAIGPEDAIVSLDGEGQRAAAVESTGQD